MTTPLCPKTPGRWSATARLARSALSDGGARIDGMWLHFSPHRFIDGERVVPPGVVVGPGRRDLHQRGQYRADLVYVIRASGVEFVSLTEWSGTDRWCFEVSPEQPLERDVDPTHRGFDSWMCPAAIVLGLVRTPLALTGLLD